MKLPVALGVAALVAARLCHSGIVWVEEAYPAAAAIQMLHGLVPYRDFWFDKPPLAPLLYLLIGAYPGVLLRLAGALFVLGCAALAFHVARRLWGGREGWIAAALTGFFLTFDTASAVMAVAPDLLMLAPHFGAVWLASKGRGAASGALAGVAFWINPKAVFVLAACLLWPGVRRGVAVGFAGAVAAGAGALAWGGALGPYWQQVWAWGALYSRDSFVVNPFAEALRRTGAWAGFHSTLVAGAAAYYLAERNATARRLALWTAISVAGVVMGWRFFPRYYFILLAPVATAAARGLAGMSQRMRNAALALLLIPLLRFGPRYVTLGRDLVLGRAPVWADLAMSQDSEAVARMVAATPGSLVVWGYRPDIFMRTRFEAGSPFLDSQPLTGVIADRHLTSSLSSAPELAALNRLRLAGSHPAIIVDGLGLYNPALAITRYPELREWLAHYREVARTGGAIIYRR